MTTLILMGLAGPANAAELIVFGDSWAEGAADELEDALRPWNVDVDPRGAGGTTADYWANTAPTALPDAIAANPDARWIWLSIGGNDLFASHYAGSGSQTAALNDANIRAMLDGALAQDPDIKVVMFGYDFLNFEQSTECIASAWLYFGTTITTWQVNTWFLEQVGDVQHDIAADYPGVTYVDSIWGTLQEAGGTWGAPNLYLPSPSRYMSDCIHPNSEGYSIIMDELAEAWWGMDEPVAALGGPAELCLGETARFESRSQSAERLRWELDGADLGDGDSVAFTPEAAGSLGVSLEAHNGPWDDLATLTLTVTDCSTPADEDTAPPGSGGEDSGRQADSGDPEPAAGGSGEGTAPTAGGCGGCASGSGRRGGLGLVLAGLLLSTRERCQRSGA